jgi:hypothetical protein
VRLLRHGGEGLLRPFAAVALILALVGALLCGGVALHEWDYYRSNPGRTGVSGVLIVFSIGATLGCLAAAALAVGIGRRRDR